MEDARPPAQRSRLCGAANAADAAAGAGVAAANWPSAELVAALDLACVFVRAADGTILHWSRGCERLYGWSPAEAVGRNVHELLHTVFPVPPAEVRAVLEREGEWSGDLRHTTRDGREIVVAVRKLLRRDDGGRIMSVAEAATDVTAARQAKAALAELIATLEQQVHQRTAELQHLAEREQALLAIAGSAIIATDLGGRITSINPAAEALLRLPATHALGRLELDFRDHAELLAQLHRYPREVLEHCGQLPLWLATAARSTLAVLPAELDSSQRSEWTYVRADGSRVACLMSISLLRGAQGEPSGFLHVMTDLSERKALEEELRERTRQAEAANRAKSAFLAHMSHELRTPLNAVIGLSELLRQRTALPADAARFVSHIHDAGQQLLALVSDVLDISRIEAGEMVLEAVPFDLPALLATALELVRPQADAKGLALLADVAPELPARVVGDPLRLRQVLLNLLANAVKFTGQGQVTLIARWRAPPPGDGGASTLWLDVADTGMGIAYAEQQRIFEPFTQADASITRRFGGTGLGLSIVQRLVKLMGGTVRLESAPGRGSTFKVRLPMAAAARGEGRGE